MEISQNCYSKSSDASFFPKIIIGDAVVDDAENISQHFNNYFAEIGLSIANGANNSSDFNFSSYLENAVSQSIVLDSHQPIEINNTFKSLNSHKACGHDDVSLFLFV